MKFDHTIFYRIATGVLCAGILLAANALTARADLRSASEKFSTAPLAWNGCYYLVRPGDNLFRIAIRHGVSYWYLAQINGLHNPNYIYAGQTLIVPCGNVPPPYPPRPPKQCAPSTTYLVKPKDNLFRIAVNHGTTINAIRNANNLWGRVLRPGMTLVIPCPGSVLYANQTPVAPVVPPVANETPLPPPPTAIPPPTTAPTAPTAIPPRADATVNLQDGQINPATIEVKAGQSVLWVNQSQNTYTILSGIPGQPNQFFASPPLPPGGFYVFKFDAGGSYSYYISENPMMVGQVNVTP